MSVAQIATELGWRPKAVRLSQNRHWWLWQHFAKDTRIGLRPLYDSVIIECLRAFYDQPHREVEEQGADWLSVWLSGGEK